jgi:hypothetical protein
MLPANQLAATIPTPFSSAKLKLDLLKILRLIRIHRFIDQFMKLVVRLDIEDMTTIGSIEAGNASKRGSWYSFDTG